jgi:hypothetical protein
MSDMHRCKATTHPCFAVLTLAVPGPPEGLETTAVTVNKEPSEPVDVNVVRVCELTAVLEVSLIAKEVVGVNIWDDWLLEVGTSDDEGCCVLVNDEVVLKLEDELWEEEIVDVDVAVVVLGTEVADVVLEKVLVVVKVDVDDVEVDEVEVVEVEELELGVSARGAWTRNSSGLAWADRTGPSAVKIVRTRTKGGLIVGNGLQTSSFKCALRP